MGFRYDTKHLSPQTQAVIRSRDESNKLISEDAKKVTSNNKLYPLSLFMRLGIESSSNLNGIQTIQVYESFCNKSDSVWFSTHSLAAGMSRAKVNEFLKAIEGGSTVEMFFVVGKVGGGNNDIRYKANVIDIISDRNGVLSPDKALTPNQWKNDKNKIWIKLNMLIPFTKLTTKDFVVASSGNVLADAIAKSQHHFGYIKKIL